MKEKITNLAIISVGTLSAVILFICLIKYILPVLLPFFIALIVVSITVSPARKLSGVIKAPERVIRLVMSLLIALIFVSGAIFIIWRTVNALWSFLADMAEQNGLYELLSSLTNSEIPIIGTLLPEELARRLSGALEKLLSSALTAIAGWITSLAGGVPQLFLFLIVSLISLTYLALDYDRLKSFLSTHLPEKVHRVMTDCYGGVITVLKKYVISYALIMAITYTTLLIGFLILGISHAPIIAFFIALADILPIIGVGTVLVPWSVYELAVGNTLLGVGLIILFVISSLIRQFSEPKIVGKNLDLHPIVTLVTLYMGYSLFGIWGMLILPVIAVLISLMLKRNNSTQVA